MKTARPSPPEQYATSVIVADDDEDARRLVETYLASEPSIALVGTATDAVDAIELASRLKPDVALLDVDMPRGGGMHATREISRRLPKTAVVLLSSMDEQRMVVDLLQAGAISYLVKGAPREKLRETVLRAHEARPTISTG